MCATVASCELTGFGAVVRFGWLLASDVIPVFPWHLSTPFLGRQFSSLWCFCCQFSIPLE